MVANVLSRVLSPRFKNSSVPTSQIMDEKNSIVSPETTDIDLVRSTSPRSTEHIITEAYTTYQPHLQRGFEGKVMDKSLRTASADSPPSRKHSYASVKEDSDYPQSFRSRHLSPDIETRWRLSGTSLKRPSFSSEVLTEVEDGDVKKDDFPFYDEDLSDAVSTRSASISNESILSTRRSSPSTLETMPDEILDYIFSLMTLEPSKDRYIDPKVDLFSCLLVSKSIHAAALRVLYRHVKIPQSKAFFKFSNSLQADTALGKLVQCLDFSHYSSIGFSRSRSTNQQTPYLTPATLRACLEQTSNLRAFLVHEHVDDELDIAVLSRLLTMPSMRALDLCSCSSKAFAEAFTAVCTDTVISAGLSSVSFLQIERLSLHECGTLKASVFEALMPKLGRLTHLDVAHTMINDKALMSISKSARITHLNLERCTQVTGAAVVEFLTYHPAVRDTLVYLNIMADASRYRLLCEDNLTDLLPALPQTLRSLNIGGARVNSSHVPHLKVLATHLEELGLKGANLSASEDLANILSLVTPDAKSEAEKSAGPASSLRYLDLTDVKSVSKMSLHYSPTTIIGLESVPLEVIELGSSVLTDLEKSTKKLKNPEWVVRELGRRGWYVRQTHLLPAGLHAPDNGYRTWKMGAKWWGMRKIPVFEQETGGMYGYFMFKRN